MSAGVAKLATMSSEAIETYFPHIKAGWVRAAPRVDLRWALVADPALESIALPAFSMINSYRIGASKSLRGFSFNDAFETLVGRTRMELLLMSATLDA
eukprot:GABV01006351.1.p1 GENE.GABV01006351.1~~GABV01006351.1.p1  ORF type:complete len:115 (-),score=35.21 GABV01006351.1:3-296(-)